MAVLSVDDDRVQVDITTIGVPQRDRMRAGGQHGAVPAVFPGGQRGILVDGVNQFPVDVDLQIAAYLFRREDRVDLEPNPMYSFLSLC